MRFLVDYFSFDRLMFSFRVNGSLGFFTWWFNPGFWKIQNSIEFWVIHFSRFNFFRFFYFWSIQIHFFSIQIHFSCRFIFYFRFKFIFFDSFIFWMIHCFESKKVNHSFFSIRASEKIHVGIHFNFLKKIIISPLGFFITQKMSLPKNMISSEISLIDRSLRDIVFREVLLDSDSTSNICIHRDRPIYEKSKSTPPGEI